MPDKDPLNISGQVVADKYRIEHLAGEGGFAMAGQEKCVRSSYRRFALSGKRLPSNFPSCGRRPDRSWTTLRTSWPEESVPAHPAHDSWPRRQPMRPRLTRAPVSTARPSGYV